MATKHVGCVEDGCEGKHVGRGYCSRHYYQRKSRGEFTDIRPKGINRGNFGCDVLDCPGVYYAKGYCQTHYNRNLQFGNPYGSPKKFPDFPI